MTCYVWRLSIEYPETPNADAVEQWRHEHRILEGQGGWAEPEFRWPTERMHLSLRGAERRKKTLERLGASVTIERSEPVVWGES